MRTTSVENIITLCAEENNFSPSTRKDDTYQTQHRFSSFEELFATITEPNQDGLCILSMTLKMQNDLNSFPQIDNKPRGGIYEAEYTSRARYPPEKVAQCLYALRETVMMIPQRNSFLMTAEYLNARKQA
jgi:hypothetical protein